MIFGFWICVQYILKSYIYSFYYFCNYGCNRSIETLFSEQIHHYWSIRVWYITQVVILELNRAVESNTLRNLFALQNCWSFWKPIVQCGWLSHPVWFTRFVLYLYHLTVCYTQINQTVFQGTKNTRQDRFYEKLEPATVFNDRVLTVYNLAGQALQVTKSDGLKQIWE